MRTLPHDPPVDTFTSIRPTLDRMIETDAGDRDRAVAEDDGPALWAAGENLIVRGMVGWLLGDRPEETAAYVRRGLAVKRAAVEAGRVLNALLFWDYLLFSLAVNDTDSAEFFATMPQDRWWNRGVRPITWYVNRSRALAALFSGREREAARHLANVGVQVFEEELPPEVREEKPIMENSVRLLQALLDRQADRFQQSLEFREAWNAERYQGRGHAAPRALVDLDGLGLCRIARDRGLTIRVRSPYLPLEMLDAR